MDNGRNEFDLDNFNLDISEKVWDTTPSRDPRNLGNKAISGPETLPTPNLEEPVSLEMPPGVFEDAEGGNLGAPTNGKAGKNTDPVEAALNVAPYDERVIKTDDKLDKEGVKVVDRAIQKLGRDGDVAEFYRTSRDMMETNLKNSYNRKLAA